ncbi:unnamed protein product [Clonostachys rosea]|uniref:Aminoglycoside phosphotransferase domain-containing protein n=1 Tax=Bionectria ochroleuca TaxID=29856 RepID=A0ABY6TQ48_BIOOC|nr:unnamed protein product [Clonostachys rosea]
MERMPDYSLRGEFYNPASVFDAPCSACTWSYARQEDCYYHSNVKLTHANEDRGVWSVGSQLIIKERDHRPPQYEAGNLRFLKEHTNLPVPTCMKDWTENLSHFIVSERLPGVTLDIVWPQLSPDARRRIAKQTADYLVGLRKLHSPRIQSLTGEPVWSTFLFPGRGQDKPHGPFSNDQELWAEFDKGLADVNVPKEARQHLQRMMPAATPYTFTHGELRNVNILVDNGNLTGIISWEKAGYFPVWWEYASASVSIRQEDKEWKNLLREYMPEFKEAKEFWWDFFALSRYPNLQERGQAFFRKMKA